MRRYQTLHAPSWILPLTLASSAFVPVDTMPNWLRAWADISPVAVTANAMRELVNGTATVETLVGPLAWILAILAIFGPLAVRLFRRAT